MLYYSRTKRIILLTLGHKLSFSTILTQHTLRKFSQVIVESL